MLLLAILTSVPSPVASQSTGAGTPPRVLVRLDGARENFSRLHLLSASRAGVLAVAQQQDGQVRLYSPTGGLIAKVGRPGEGPGEFRRVDALGWKADTAWVADYQVGRLTLVGADGRIVRSMALPTAPIDDRLPVGLRGFRWTPRVAAVLGDGVIVYRLQRLVDGPSGRPAVAREVEGWLIKGTVEGVLTAPVLQLPRSGCNLRADGAVGVQVRLHLCPEPLSALAPDGSSIAVVTMSAPTRRSAEYTLTLHSAGGTRIAARSMQVPSRPVPRPIRDTMIADYQNAIPAIRDLTRGYRIPEFYPPVTRLHVGPTGDVWVTVRNPGGTSRWQVFDRTAKHLGDVPVPEGGNVAAVDARGIWANVVDDEGLEHIVLFARPGS